MSSHKGRARIFPKHKLVVAYHAVSFQPLSHLGKINRSRPLVDLHRVSSAHSDMRPSLPRQMDEIPLAARSAPGPWLRRPEISPRARCSIHQTTTMSCGSCSAAAPPTSSFIGNSVAAIEATAFTVACVPVFRRSRRFQPCRAAGVREKCTRDRMSCTPAIHSMSRRSCPPQPHKSTACHAAPHNRSFSR